MVWLRCIYLTLSLMFARRMRSQSDEACKLLAVVRARSLLMLHSQTCFWNNEILTPIQKNAMTGPGATAFKKLKILLDRMMLRRTKVHITMPPLLFQKVTFFSSLGTTCR